MRCPRLPQPRNGIHTGSRFLLDEEVVYQCNRGYSLVWPDGNDDIIEQESGVINCILNEETNEGMWSSQPPSCRSELYQNNIIKDFLMKRPIRILVNCIVYEGNKSGVWLGKVPSFLLVLVKDVI